MRKMMMLVVAMVAVTASAWAQSVTESTSVISERKNFTRVQLEETIMKFNAIGADCDGYYAGYTLGAMRGLQLIPSAPFYFGIGLNATFVTAKVDGTDDGRENFFHFQVPVQVSARIGNERFSVEPYGGLHWKLNLVAKIWDGNEKVNAFSSSDMEEPFNRAQIGWQAGLGFNINKIHATIGYDRDLSYFHTPSEMILYYFKFGVGVNF